MFEQYVHELMLFSYNCAGQIKNNKAIRINIAVVDVSEKHVWNYKKKLFTAREVNHTVQQAARFFRSSLGYWGGRDRIKKNMGSLFQKDCL